MFQKIIVLFADRSTIWENMDGFAEKYHLTTVICLLPMLAHAYNIKIDRGVGSTLNDREVVDGLNDTDKIFLLF